jgi:hypothetical protein
MIPRIAHVIAVIAILSLAISSSAAQPGDILISTPDTVPIGSQKRPASHLLPGLSPSSRGVTCTWRELDGANVRDVLAPCNPFRNAVGFSTPYDLKPADTRSDPPYGAVWGTISSKTTTDYSAVPLAGDWAIVFNHTFISDVQVLISSSPPRLETTSVRGSQYVLTHVIDGKWQTLDNIGSRDGNQLASPGEHGSAIACDPDSGFIALMLYSTLRGYRRDGSHWDVEMPKGLVTQWGSIIRRPFLVMGTARYMVFDSSHAYYVNANRVIDSFNIPTIDRLHPRYFKLLGGYFARTSWDAVDSTKFRIELRDTLGTLMQEATFARPTNTSDYTLVQSRGDSTIAILFGGDNGVHASVMSWDFSTVIADTLMSRTTGRVAHPAGLFIDDALAIVWEDYRDSVSRIYGTMRPIKVRSINGESPDLPPVRAAYGSHVHDYRTLYGQVPILYPNPTEGMLNVAIDLKSIDGAQLDIFNSTGELVFQRHLFTGHSGWHMETVDIGELPVGLYIARLSHLNGIIVEKIVKR